MLAGAERQQRQQRRSSTACLTVGAAVVAAAAHNFFTALDPQQRTLPARHLRLHSGAAGAAPRTRQEDEPQRVVLAGGMRGAAAGTSPAQAHACEQLRTFHR